MTCKECRKANAVEWRNGPMRALPPPRVVQPARVAAPREHQGHDGGRAMMRWGWGWRPARACRIAGCTNAARGGAFCTVHRIKLGRRA